MGFFRYPYRRRVLLTGAQLEKRPGGKERERRRKKGKGATVPSAARVRRPEFGVRRSGENIVAPTGADRSQRGSKGLWHGVWRCGVWRCGVFGRAMRRTPPPYKNRVVLGVTAVKKDSISPRSLVFPFAVRGPREVFWPDSR